MRIKISFYKNTSTIKNVRPLINGFMNKCLGENNRYHGKFSQYNISTMIGGKLNKEGNIDYEDGSYIYVSSDDKEFITQFLDGLFEKRPSVGDMKFKTYDVEDIMVNDHYDIVRTISPIALKKDNAYILYDNPDFISTLTQKSKAKLINCGYDEKNVNTLSIEPFHFENAKKCFADTKGKLFTPSSKVMLLVRGDKKIRRALYELGLGCNTGYGFGTVTVNYNKF